MDRSLVIVFDVDLLGDLRLILSTMAVGAAVYPFDLLHRLLRLHQPLAVLLVLVAKLRCFPLLLALLVPQAGKIKAVQRNLSLLLQQLIQALHSLVKLTLRSRLEEVVEPKDRLLSDLLLDCCKVIDSELMEHLHQEPICFKSK